MCLRKFSRIQKLSEKMLFSNQEWFCTSCGIKQNSPMTGGTLRCVGREWKCCSIKCHREVEWKRTLSILGKEYTPDTRNDEDNEK